MERNSETLMITVNVSGMNSPIKRKGIEWIKNQNPTICCLQETHLRQVITYFFNKSLSEDLILCMTSFLNG